MEILKVEGSWEEIYPVNWEFIGIVSFPNEIIQSPEFIMIDGTKYKKE